MIGNLHIKNVTKINDLFKIMTLKTLCNYFENKTNWVTRNAIRLQQHACKDPS
jgi:hypothetical protein